MMSNNDLYAVALSVASGISGALRGKMELSPVELFEMLGGASLPTQPFIAANYPSTAIDAAKAIMEKLERTKSIHLLHYWNDAYPELLRQINNPPVALYYRGQSPPERSVAVVGTRKPSEYSRNVTRIIVENLVRAGFAITSGMARGIDGEAHAGALACGGSTIGVLANGIDIVYPSTNRDIYHKIIENGSSSLLSEYPPEIYSGRWTFVRRNRIISGLSAATIVIQAGVKSGTLITARYAAEQGRDVFVCPGGALDEGFTGSHRLIDEGARILYDVDALMESLTNELQLNLFRVGADFVSDSDSGSKIMRYLSGKSADIDTIIRECGIPAHEFQETLVLLEMEGLVRRKGNILSVG
ncbi:MAG: DNA-processing protein DprA [Leptospirales bacterium]|nr:DNA-processing protein DprA [Leptospirales bacterium]